MNRHFPIFLLLLCPFAPAGAQVASHAPTVFKQPAPAPAPGPSPTAGKPVARVNGSVLTEADLVRITSIQLNRLRGRLEERRLTLEVTPAAEAHLARTGFDPDFGARPLRRVIQRQVEDPLALAVLEGRFAEGSTVTVDVTDDHIVIS